MGRDLVGSVGAGRRAERGRVVRRLLLAFGLAGMLFSTMCFARACSVLLGLFGPFSSTIGPGPSDTVVTWYWEFDMAQVITPSVLPGGQSMAVRLLEVVGASPAVMADADMMAARGFLAVRVPNAPPTFTTSSILSPTVEFSYYSPPNAAVQTTRVISVTRRDEYLPLVNERYPVADSQSHWEVWWLPEGAHFPIPSTAFRLKSEGKPSLAMQGYIDFKDASGRAVAGRELSVVLYTGGEFIGPFTVPMQAEDADATDALGVPGNPKVLFDHSCQGASLSENLVGTGAFTTTHYLENYESSPRVYSVTASSSQGWDYTWYTRALNQSGTTRMMSLPFTVTVGPKRAGQWPPVQCMTILAVVTPTVSADDAFRESLVITATSVVSPMVQANAWSFALAPSYRLNATEHRLWLPVIRAGPD